MFWQCQNISIGVDSICSLSYSHQKIENPSCKAENRFVFKIHSFLYRNSIIHNWLENLQVRNREILNLLIKPRYVQLLVTRPEKGGIGTFQWFVMETKVRRRPYQDLSVVRVCTLKTIIVKIYITTLFQVY